MFLQAVRAVYARQDRLFAIADNKRKEQQRRDAEEKERTLREFEEARIRLAEAERAEAEARRRAHAEFRSELDEQVNEKGHRNDAEKAAARATQLLLQERARAAEREIRAAKEAAAEARKEYRALLEKQMEASRALREMKNERERAAIAASLDDLEGDPELLNAVAERLAQRAAAADKAAADAAAQAAAVREALIAAGLNPDESLLARR